MKTVSIHTTINKPVELGFAAWTDPDHLARWFAQRAAGKSCQNEAFGNSNSERSEFPCFELNQRVQFTWENPNHAPGTLVDICFQQLDACRHSIRLTHSGLESDDDAESMSIGWNWAFASLRSYLETGKPLTFDEWRKRQAGANS